MSQSPFSYAVGPLSSLGLYGRRVTKAVVGRPFELEAVERELASAGSGMVCITVEGEPGIGKTRFLLAVEELARAKGFLRIAVTADEEICGPFLLARSIFASPAVVEAVQGSPAEQAVQRVCDALSSMDDPSLDSLAPDRKLVRVFDLAAVAFRALAAEHPLAVLIDDLQWADEDSLRMLRYVVRTDASSRILLVLASRPEEVALVNEAVKLLADMERMGLMRRLKLGRFTQTESTEFLRQVLGGPINLSSAAAMHAQAEGVPFILAEQAQAYREARMIQQIDGVWTLARNAERLLPSAVRTLIQRRAGRLPETTKVSLAEAAVLGRSFSLRDLRDVKMRLGSGTMEVNSLAESLAPAVATGLLIQHPDGSAADYSFTHEGVREYAATTLAPARQRAVHGAIVQMLTAGGEPPAGCFPLLAQHALAAGQTELCARVSVEAARNALKARAPEEVLRMVNLAQPVAVAPRDRVALLRLQDDALDMLRRPAQRLEGLAQLAALVEALGDSQLELEVMLRRAASFRLSKEFERAAEMARRVRQLAAERGDDQAELAACLELGQDLLRIEIGDSYMPTPSEVDLDGAEDAFQCAAALAERLGDEANLAAATRELGVIAAGHVRAWFVSRIPTGELTKVIARQLAGEPIADILQSLPVASIIQEANSRFSRALELYDRLGDRQGTMSTIIAMAYVTWGPELHTSGGAKRIEEIRRLAARMNSLTKESERALAEAQMLYGAHVYAQAKVFPDTALEKGREAYAAAQALGDRALEFASAGGVALAYADMGAIEEAERWLGQAAAVASAEPTSLRARLLEIWRGRVRSAAGDVAGMRGHLERAVQLATDQGRPAARCEALALLALEASRLGGEHKDEELLALAERCAHEAKVLLPALPGHPPWGAQADAALARVALTRGTLEAAAIAGRAVMAALEAAMTEDLYLEVRLPAADALLTAGSNEEQAAVRGHLRFFLAMIMPRFLDEKIRVQWLTGPVGRELTRLAGPLETPPSSGGTAAQAPVPMAEEETVLLRLLTEGRTNREIAEELRSTDEAVARQLAALFAKIGASSRADATAFALMGKLG